MPQKPPLKPIKLRELRHDSDWMALYPLIKQLNKELTQKAFDALLADMLQRGYRCVGAFSGTTLVGAAGFWIGTRFWCKKFIDLDNVVVDTEVRSRGIGSKLVAWIEKEGRKQGCTMAGLDSYTTAQSAHRFYFREGYSILGYHFTKTL